MTFIDVISYCDVDLTVVSEFYPANKGVWEKGGLQISPDEPATYEVQDVHLGGQSIWDLLSVEQIENIEKMLYEIDREPDGGY